MQLNQQRAKRYKCHSLILSISVQAANFGGLDAVGNQLAEDAKPKQSLIEKHLAQP